MSRTLGFALVLCSLAPFAAAQGTPDVGPPAVLAGDRTPGPAGGVQQFPAIAAGASSHLAVWTDHRSGFEDLTTGVGCRDVYAQILRDDGTPLTPLPFRVAGGLGRKEDVKVAWNGTHWLVTWQNVVPTTFNKAAALLGARVDTAGNVLDQVPLVLKSYPWSSTFSYALGSDGDKWAFVIQGNQGGEADVEGWLVDAGGQASMATPVVFPTTYQISGFGLCWDGSQYLLTYTDSGTRAYRLTSTLGVIGTQIFVSTGDTGGASAATDGNRFMVVFSDWSSIGMDVKYREVTATGGLGPITAVTSDIESNNQPKIVWNGSGFTVVWWKGYFFPSSLRYARLSAAGALLDPGGVDFGQGVAPSFQAASSIGDGNTQVVWIDKLTTEPNTGDVFGSRVRQTGVDPAVAVSTSATRQGFPALAAGNSGYLTVFTGERAGSVSILAQRTNESGVAIDAEPIEVGAKETFGNPAVAWNGQHYLVVWHDLQIVDAVTDDIVLGRRLAADGTFLDAAPFQILEGADPSVAAVGDTFLVAARFAWTTQIFRIMAARVNGAGVVIDPTPFTVGDNYARYPSVAAFSDAWLVAWQRNPTHDNPSAETRARVLTTGGTLTGTWVLGPGTAPAAAASPSVGLVAWGGANLQARRFASDGSLIGATIAVSSATGAQTAAAAAWNGDAFVVAWEDARNAEAFFDDRSDIYATRITESGTVLDPTGLAIAVTANHDQMPAVGGRDGKSLVVYSGFHPEHPLAASRTTVVGIGTGAPGVAYCFGDGSGTLCPCGNSGAAGRGCANSASASGAELVATGSVSASGNGLVLSGAGLVPNQAGLYFQAMNPANGGLGMPFGDGLRCASGSARRLQVVLASSGGTSSTSVDVGAVGAVGAGDVRTYQLWYRDTSGGLCGTGFNLTNGIEIAWLP